MSKVNSLTIDSRLASLYKPNVFTVPNVVMDSKAAVNQSIDSKRTLNQYLPPCSGAGKDYYTWTLPHVTTGHPH